MRILLMAAVMACTPLAAVAAADMTGPRTPPAAGGGAPDFALPADLITPTQRAAIHDAIDHNVRRLHGAGKLSTDRSAGVAFDWPLATSVSIADPGVHGISNFVDQDSAFPGALLDYNCGARTYDLASGYNHRGIDFFSWPYGWRRMDEDGVEVVAAAAGTIVHKADGNYDRSCGFGGGDWNAVFVRHADGSTAWYGHMKNGSLTAKDIGETVAAGEYLGVVGSSGNSTGPHLHLEVYDGSSQLIEPYAGTCNALNASSWWSAQREYYDSALNGLETASAAPVFPACPASEPDHSRRVFASSERIFMIVFYRDQLISQTSGYTLYRPDGSIHWDWTHNSDAAHYSASYWYWFIDMAGLPTGTWRWRVSYEGATVERAFDVVADADNDGDGIADHLDNCMTSANPSQLDSDGDRYGNACDPDLNGDRAVNFSDLNAFKAAFFSTPGAPTWNEHADFNGDSAVNFLDLQLMKDLFFGSPGPSAFVP